MPQNTVTITGNLADDPELRFTPSGQAVARFNIAYSERYRDNSTGEWKDGDTSYFTVYAWGDLGEHVAESFTRGSRVIVTGAMRQRSWERDGEKRYTVEIRADDVGASVRFATVTVHKTARPRPNGSGDADPWESASTERPAATASAAPESGPGPEPAADGPQGAADGPQEPGPGNDSGNPARPARGRRSPGGK